MAIPFILFIQNKKEALASLVLNFIKILMFTWIYWDSELIYFFFNFSISFTSTTSTPSFIVPLYLSDFRLEVLDEAFFLIWLVTFGFCLASSFSRLINSVPLEGFLKSSMSSNVLSFFFFGGTIGFLGVVDFSGFTSTPLLFLIFHLLQPVLLLLPLHLADICLCYIRLH